MWNLARCGFSIPRWPNLPCKVLPATCTSPWGVIKTVWVFEAANILIGKSLSCSIFLGSFTSPSAIFDDANPRPSSPSQFLPQAQMKAFSSIISSWVSSSCFCSWAGDLTASASWFALCYLGLLWFGVTSLLGSIERGEKSLYPSSSSSSILKTYICSYMPLDWYCDWLAFAPWAETLWGMGAYLLGSGPWEGSPWLSIKLYYGILWFGSCK